MVSQMNNKEMPKFNKEEMMAKTRELMKLGENEERIGIMVCKKSTDRCSGVWCHWAFEKKAKSFEQYKDRNVKLFTFIHCSGCDTDWDNDPKFNHKLEELHNVYVNKIHFGVCIKNSCPNVEELCKQLEKRGIEWEIGTH